MQRIIPYITLVTVLLIGALFVAMDTGQSDATVTDLKFAPISAVSAAMTSSPIQVRTINQLGIDPTDAASASVSVLAQTTQTLAYLSYGGVSIIDINTKANEGYLVSSNAIFMATTPDGAFLYVVENGANTVGVFDTATKTKVATVSVGTQPIDIAITPDGAYAYVTNRHGNSVSVIQTSNNSVISTVTVGSSPFGVAITPNGQFAYVTNEQTDSVSVISTASNSVVGTITSPDIDSPTQVAFTPNGAFAYVTNFNSGVAVIQTSDNSVVTNVTAGTSPFGIAVTPDGNFAYVSNYFSNDVSVIQTSDNSVVATIPTTSGGTWLRDVGITPDGQFAYVAVQTSSKTEVISTATYTVVDTIAGGGYGIAFANMTGSSEPVALTSRGPAANGVGVVPSANISATFDTPIDAGSVTTRTFTVRSSQRGLYTHAATVVSNTVTLNPSPDFFTGEKVSVVGSAGVLGTEGQALTPTQWSFTAGPVTNRCVAGFTDIGAALTNIDFGSVAWADYDGDGDLDILLSGRTATDNSDATLIYRNDGGGVFTDIGAGLLGLKWGSVAWGDYDNDGDPDVLVTGSEGATNTNNSTPVTRLYRNDGGSFTQVNSGLGNYWQHSDAQFGDYDNDGDLDIVLAGRGSEARIYRNDGNDSFTNINAGLPTFWGASLDWGDYDNDGDLDLLVTGELAGTGTFISRVYRNDSGAFTDINAGLTGVKRGDARWGDYDNDGYVDILLTGETVVFAAGYTAKIYRNVNGSSFSDINASLTGVLNSSVDWGDYDNDGDLDVLWAGAGSNVLAGVHRNDGGGTFTNINAGLQGVNYAGVAWGDYDNDGDLDILLTGFVPGPGPTTRIYRNDDCASGGSIDTSKYYRLQTKFLEAENKCLEGNRLDPNSVLSGAAFMDTCQDVTGQFWKFVDAGNGYYRLQTKFLEAENRCLEGNRLDPNSVLGGAAFMDTCKDVTGQLWKVADAGEGYHRMQTKFLEAENKCLEGNRLDPNSVLSGAAFMDDCQDVLGQLWKFVDAKPADGNGDGIPDNQQANVETITSNTGNYVTLAASTGVTLTNVQAISPTVAPPPNVAVPQGLIGFDAQGLGVGGSLTMTVIVRTGPVATSYWKYGPTLDNSADHWYEFTYDPATNTGAKINGRTITLYFVDGARGDSDLQANGTITDPGGPAGIVLHEFLYLPLVQGQ
ncbi:MAG TPA: FG-GAP-like repeat-containing protein [Caldilineaceae bacterium]|nr:FG-GAP-like repeat-containing protein [Caldilineaceae bacterium]